MGASEAKPLTLWPIDGGLVADPPPTTIPPTAWAVTNNIFGHHGRMMPRHGLTASLAALSTPVHHYTREDTLAGVVTKCALGIEYAHNAVTFKTWNGVTWDDRTPAGGLTGSPDIPATSCRYKGKLYFTTGVSNLQTWDGAATTAVEVVNSDPTLTPFTAPRHIHSWDGRLWMADCVDGSTRIPYRVAWSDLLIDNVWRETVASGSAGYQDMTDSSQDDPDPITALMDTRDSLLAFKANSIYYANKVAYPTFYELDRFVRGIGCVARNTLLRRKETLLWLGDDDVYRMEGLAFPAGLLEQRKSKMHFYDVVNTSYLDRATALWDPLDDMYWLLLPAAGGSALTKLFIFNLDDPGTWWEGSIGGSAVRPVCSTGFRNGPQDYDLTVGSADGGFYVVDENSHLDGGSSYPCSGSMKLLDALQFSQNKFETMELQKLAVHAASGKITASVQRGPAIDDLETEIVGEIVYGSSQRYLPNRFSGKPTRFLQLQLTWDTSSEANIARVEGLTAHLMPKDAAVR